MVETFKRALLFSQGAAEALNDNQMILSLDGDKDTIEDLSRAIKKPRGDAQGFQISKVSVICLKLFAFLRGVDDWTETT